MNGTLAYYDQNADAFVAGTQAADMSGQYALFLPYLTPGCKILDLGCGSGRDSAYFTSLGFAVTAVDGSEALCKRAKANYGLDVRCLSFAELAFQAEFDAVWACASLLHVSKAHMPLILSKVSDALKPGGILYASFKYGTGERICGGRFFNDYTEKDLKNLLNAENHLVLLQYQITEDVRPEHSGEKWLNFIAKRGVL